MKKKIGLFTTLFSLFIILLCTSCNQNRLDVDISEIKVELEVLRMEDDIFENKLNTPAEFTKKYGTFVNDYSMGILGFTGNDSMAFEQLMMYKTDQNVLKINKAVQDQFGDFKPQKDELTKAYQYFKFYYPNIKIPKIITFIGFRDGFSLYTNPVGEGYIGIATDMHLGKDFKPYEFAGLEQFWRKTCIPQTIATNHMMAQANDLFLSSNKSETFLDEIIYFGKLLYFLDATLPEIEDHIKIGLTKEEFEWCKQQEHDIWTYIVREKLLYDTDKKKYSKLMDEGPKTVLEGVPEGAPAKLGRYIGWMAVRQLMTENEDISLPDLMKNSDAKGLLQQSGYKP